MYAIQRNAKEIKMRVCKQPVGLAANMRRKRSNAVPPAHAGKGNRVLVPRGLAGYALGSEPTTLTNDTHSPGAPPRLCVSASLRPRSMLAI